MALGQIHRGFVGGYQSGRDARVEAPAGADLAPVEAELHSALHARFAVKRLAPGSLPAAEHKTRLVHRTARGDRLPAAVENVRRENAP